MNECPICRRKVETDTQFCHYHDLANKNINNSFENWKSAMGIQWDAYLVRLSEEENLGKFVRDVIEFLMQQDDSSEWP